MIKLLSIAVIIMLVSGVVWSADFSTITEDDWQPLFNGEDLDGWVKHTAGHGLNQDPKNVFRVTDGMLEVNYDEVPDWNAGGQPFGHLGYEVEKFSHYIVAAEYKFHKPQSRGGPDWAYENNGIMVHSEATKDMSTADQYPTSIEVQLLGPENKQNNQGITANLCTPNTHVYDIEVPGGISRSGKYTEHCTTAKKVDNTWDEEGWTRTEVLVLGDSIIKHIVMDDTVFVYKKPSLDNGQTLKEGYIAVQGESAPTLFRKIEIVNLVGCMDEDAENYKAYHIKEKEPSDCEEKVGLSPKKSFDIDFRLTRTNSGVRLYLPSSYQGPVSITNIKGKSIRKTTSSAVLDIHSNEWPSGLYTAAIAKNGVTIRKQFVLFK